MSTPRPSTTAAKPARDFTFIQPAARRLTEYEALIVHQQPDPLGYDLAGGGRHGAEAFLLRTDGSMPWRTDSTRLKHPDWYRYRDPAQHWQRTYVRHQEQQEGAIERATEDAGHNGTLASLDAGWVRDTLSTHWRACSHLDYAIFRALCPAQREALGDTISMALCFQSFDHLRQAQDVVIYLVELGRHHDAVDDAAGRRAWMDDPVYQPMRHLAERILNTSDWAELMIGLNLAVAPLLQSVALSYLVRANAGANGDDVAAQIVTTAERDRRRNLAATEAFVRMVLDPAIGPAADNRIVIEEWLARWSGWAREAADALRPAFAKLSIKVIAFDDAITRSRREAAAIAEGLGLSTGAAA